MPKQRSVLLFALSLLICLSMLQGGAAQDNPIPTLIPPTRVPTEADLSAESLLAESAVGRIQRDGRVRIGVLYNEPPFAELNIRGEVIGFDADLARKFAELWGVELDLVQVTRQTAQEWLERGLVDLLIAAQIHRREADRYFEFSHTYHIGQQSMMVRADDNAAAPLNMASRRIGYVIASDGESAVAEWLATTRLPVTLQSYLTLDRAYVALLTGEVDGIVESHERLLRAAVQPEQIKILEEPVIVEPFAAAMPRHDIHLRNLVNRTLQYLANTGDLEKLHLAHFPGQRFAFEALPIWANVGDEAPKPAQFAIDVPYPPLYTAPRILNATSIRAAGLSDSAQTESEERINALHRSLVEQMAQRWGVTVEFLPQNAGNPVDLVASGQADLAVGVRPDWNAADRVDFSGPYLLHGDRLMIQSNANIAGFRDLRGLWVAYPLSDAGAEGRIGEWADSVQVNVRTYGSRDEDIAFAILVENNADAGFGDSLVLIPQVQANSEDLKLTLDESGRPRWYSRSYLAFAVPRNDLDFRLLVDYTLQEFAEDGTLETLLRPLTLADEFPEFDFWPGPSEWFGLRIGT